mmetsp:Transcript_32464/g.91996  ORF Transcript_32464/g.91996 Transcript_32464/m.91996 type:complete len:1169 (+) Transcript_32464:431-3937(+)
MDMLYSNRDISTNNLKSFESLCHPQLTEITNSPHPRRLNRPPGYLQPSTKLDTQLGSTDKGRPVAEVVARQEIIARRKPIGACLNMNKPDNVRELDEKSLEIRHPQLSNVNPRSDLLQKRIDEIGAELARRKESKPKPADVSKWLSVAKNNQKEYLGTHANVSLQKRDFKTVQLNRASVPGGSSRGAQMAAAASTRKESTGRSGPPHPRLAPISPRSFYGSGKCAGCSDINVLASTSTVKLCKDCQTSNSSVLQRPQGKRLPFHRQQTTAKRLVSSKTKPEESVVITLGDTTDEEDQKDKANNEPLPLPSPVDGAGKRCSMRLLGLSTSQPALWRQLKGLEAVFPPEGGHDSIPVFADDLMRLQPEEFLNDNVIDFYMKRLWHMLDPELKARCHFFNSHFYKKLTGSNADEAHVKSATDKHALRHARVSRWTKTTDIFAKDFLFVPIHDALHWSLAIVCHPGAVPDSRSSCILLLDSMLGGHNQRTVAAALRAYLQIEWSTKAKAGGNSIPAKWAASHLKVNDSLSQAPGGLQFNRNNMKERKPRLPRQSNHTDCGLFLLTYLEFFLHSLPEIYDKPFEDENGKVFEAVQAATYPEFLTPKWFEASNASLLREFLQYLVMKLLREQTRMQPGDRRAELLDKQIFDYEATSTKYTSPLDYMMMRSRTIRSGDSDSPKISNDDPEDLGNTDGFSPAEMDKALQMSLKEDLSQCSRDQAQEEVAPLNRVSGEAAPAGETSAAAAQHENSSDSEDDDDNEFRCERHEEDTVGTLLYEARVPTSAPQISLGLECYDDVDGHEEPGREAPDSSQQTGKPAGIAAAALPEATSNEEDKEDDDVRKMGLLSRRRSAGTSNQVLRSPLYREVTQLGLPGECNLRRDLLEISLPQPRPLPVLASTSPVDSPLASPSIHCGSVHADDTHGKEKSRLGDNEGIDLTGAAEVGEPEGNCGDGNEPLWCIHRLGETATSAWQRSTDLPFNEYANASASPAFHGPYQPGSPPVNQEEGIKPSRPAPPPCTADGPASQQPGSHKGSMDKDFSALHISNEGEYGAAARTTAACHSSDFHPRDPKPGRNYRRHPEAGSSGVKVPPDSEDATQSCSPGDKRQAKGCSPRSLLSRSEATEPPSRIRPRGPQRHFSLRWERGASGLEAPHAKKPRLANMPGCEVIEIDQ